MGDTTTRHYEGDGWHNNCKGQHGNMRHDDGNRRQHGNGNGQQGDRGYKRRATRRGSMTKATRGKLLILDILF